MRRSLLPALEALVVLLAAWRLWEVGSAIAARLAFDGDIEWMEGATLVSALRVRDGLPLYAAPTPEYIGFIYPPLYAGLVGTLAHVFPLGYALGRAVSLSGSVLAAVMAALSARREGARPALWLGVAALFACGWDDGGTFYDLVRTDGVTIGLASVAIWAGRGATRAHGVVSGLALAAAFAAKQNAAVFGLPILAWRWRALGRREGLVFLAASAGPALLFLAGESALTGGWFWTYLVGVPAHHGVVAERLFPIAQQELWKAYPVSTTAAVLLALGWRRAPYWLGVSLAAVVVVSVMRGHVGGFMNVLIPAFWVQSLWAVVVATGLGRPALAAGLVAAELLLAPVTQAKVEKAEKAVATHVGDLRFGRPGSAGRIGEDVRRLFAHDFARFVPTAADQAQVDALVEEIRALPAPVLLPHAPWYAVKAGQPPTFALICLWDIDHKGGPLRGAVDGVVRRAMREGHWASAVLPDDKLGYGLKEAWERGPSLDARGVETRVGWRVRLRQVWTPKAAPAAPDGAEPQGGDPADAPATGP